MKKLVVLVLLSGIAIWFLVHQSGTTEILSVEEYVREHISELSLEKEVLGGKFHVTNIRAEDGVGTVSYEDGHVSFTADFSYTVDYSDMVTIHSFTPRKN